MSDTTVNQSILDSINGVAAQKKAMSAAEEMSERFMTLFLAQLRNQDPLSPMENAEMTSQLAQMNMVSGLESLNATMKTLLASYDESLSLQAANLVGKNVLVPGNQVALGEAGALFGVQLAAPADKVTVVIKDQTGQEVSRQELGQMDKGSFAFYWDGAFADGSAGNPGDVFSFSVEASLDGEAVSAKPLQAGTISALVRDKNGAFVLEVAGLGNVTLGDVQQVF
ncbi:MAG: flagellar hook assembly protein FlgD [Zoogloeaceae bacterium]|jgi:flagellar basal-body rod modification protein FlgD|nr:flagellar hook assembly protein FlgD [Zoogloeaceae bacterium]